MKHTNKGYFEEIYHIVETIPEGSVMTYGMIANLIGNPRASRIVGYAMHSAPPELNLPCHRVVNKNGNLSPGDIFGGEGMQRRVLEQEGITFKSNGYIDMEKHCIKFIQKL